MEVNGGTVLCFVLLRENKEAENRPFEIGGTYGNRAVKGVS